MPYIKQEDRERLEKLYIDWAEHDLEKGIKNAGELNYTVTKLVHNYIKKKGESYSAYNEVIGALECAKMELYRRKISPYEDVKIKENGDV